MKDIKNLEGVKFYGGSAVADLIKDYSGVSLRYWRGNSDTMLYTIVNGILFSVEDDRDIDNIHPDDVAHLPLVDLIKWVAERGEKSSAEKPTQETSHIILHKDGKFFIGTEEQCSNLVKSNAYWRNADVYAKTGSVSFSVSFK